MTKEAITMSQKEVDRLHVIQRTFDIRGGQAVAARQLGLSVRQIKRLVQRYRRQGVAGLVSWRWGQRPPNALAPALRDHVLTVVRARYPDFAPTLAHEKLTAHHGYTFSVETLRQWPITADVWQPNRRRAPPASIPAGPVWASWCKLTARPMTGSRAAPRSVPYWSSLTTPPAG